MPASTLVVRELELKRQTTPIRDLDLGNSRASFILSILSRLVSFKRYPAPPRRHHHLVDAPLRSASVTIVQVYADMRVSCATSSPKRRRVVVCFIIFRHLPRKMILTISRSQGIRRTPYLSLRFFRTSAPLLPSTSIGIASCASLCGDLNNPSVIPS